MNRTLAYTIAVGLLIDATVYTASQASRVHDGTQVLTVALLAAGGLVATAAAVGYGAGAGFQAGSARMYARRLARNAEIAKAPEPEVWAPLGYTPASRFDEYWAETRRAAAEAEPGDWHPYDAVHAAPKLPPTLPPTLPMPVEELREFDYEPAGVAR